MARRTLALACAGLIVVSLRADAASQNRLELSTSSVDADVSTSLDRYARGDGPVELPAGISPLELQRRLRRSASRWIGPENAADASRRRLTVATFALELIDRNFEAAWDRRRGFALDLLEWSCGLLRDGPVTPPELFWHVAAVGLLERASSFRLIRGSVSFGTGNSAFVTHITHAERRFPGDGRWLLAHAIDAEHAVWPPPLDEDILRPPPDTENRIRGRLEAAFDAPVVGAEAHLRWGYFHVRRGRLELALREFEAVGRPDDRALRYWQHLFRGQALARMSRSPEAAESYRVALAAFPNAQAATLALASLLARDGDITEAGARVNSMFRFAPAADPWNIYGSPTYRHWSASLRQLREAIRP